MSSHTHRSPEAALGKIPPPAKFLCQVRIVASAFRPEKCKNSKCDYHVLNLFRLGLLIPAHLSPALRVNLVDDFLAGEPEPLLSLRVPIHLFLRQSVELLLVLLSWLLLMLLLW